MHAKAKLEGIVGNDSIVFAFPLPCFLSLSICLVWFDEHFLQEIAGRGWLEVEFLHYLMENSKDNMVWFSQHN